MMNFMKANQGDTPTGGKHRKREENIRNERKRAVTRNNFYYAQYSLIARLDVAVIPRRYLKLA
jgi:hypothetical protein